MRVDAVMTRFPTTVELGTSVGRAAELVAASEAGQLMVLGPDDRFVGVLSEGDLVRALLPDTAEVRAAGGTVTGGFGALHAKAAAVAARPIDDLVVRDPATIAPDDDAAAAAVALTGARLRRLPVVADGRLLGTVSRIDLCRALLAGSRRTAAPAAAAPPPTTPAPATPPPTKPAPAASPATAPADAAAARIAAARAALAAARAGSPGGLPTSRSNGV